MTSIEFYTPSLSTNDSAVLQALFDAESSPSNSITIDPSLPPTPQSNIPPSEYDSLKARELSIVRSLQDTNTQNIKAAISDLDTLISEYPSYPSAYVNRAQALRMLVPETDELLDATHAELVGRLFADLGHAISLCTPKPADPVSPVQARILADAHTHRGYLLLKAVKVKREGEVVGLERLSGLGADELEEMASRDFFFGGRYGNKVAQQLAVQTNPYAKMCGAIVKEAMRKEVVG